ncbi:MAG TPA: hypothetical protein VFO69_02485 [Allosphingosinicella sp.]|nr:hypothetical protein [Allosphingosinicella sp.]
MMAGAMNAAGARPNVGGVLGGLLAGRRGATAAPSHVRRLQLQLGGSTRAAGTPSAEHLPPAVLGAGPSLPLVTPQAAPTQPSLGGTWPPQMERPRGRILVYWGCGDRARPGQPFEIDLSRLAAGQIPPAFAQQSYRPMTPPSAATHPTYGEWPNERSQTVVPANASLVGNHLVRGNYSPEIRFALTPGQDFLAPVTLTSNSAASSGAVPVAWQPVPNARAWLLTAMGAAQDGTMVMWSSSESQLSMMGMMDYLSQDEIARLLQQRVLLPAQTQQCTVPAEVAQRVQGAMLSVTAFGPEANFSHPVRPANARASWAPDWTVKLRTRSAYMGMLGMDMEAMMRGESGNDQPQQERRRRRSLRDRILGQ